jgi:hypothetical protein
VLPRERPNRKEEDGVTTAQASDIDPAWQAHAGEARLLVSLLRTSRLALLYCDEGTEKSSFLTSALMPLLGRRAEDRFMPADARETGVAAPPADRRKRPAVHNAACTREFVVQFDDWSDDPLPALLARIHQVANTCEAERSAPWQRLGDTLEALGTRLDASFIILLDRFEAFLCAPPDHAGNARFASDWVDAVLRAKVPVSFLVAVDEEARPRLGHLRNRIAGFDDFSLKLTRPAPTLRPPKATQPPDAVTHVAQPAPPVLTEAVMVSPPALADPPKAERAEVTQPKRKIRPPKVKRPVQPRSEVKAEDVYALIESTLSRTVTEVSDDPFSAGQAATEPSARAPEEVPPTNSAVASSVLPRSRWQSVITRIGRMLRGANRPGRDA